MHIYILRRLGLLIPVLLGVMFIIFTLNYITPGDPARLMLGEQAEQWQIDQLREEMGLNDTYIVRLGNFFLDTFKLDFGRSLNSRRPVIDEITARFPTTIHLAAMSVLFAVVLGIPLGMISAIKQYSLFDNTVTIIGLIGVSIPNFWQGLMLALLFSVFLGWLPPTGWSSPLNWIMPILTLSSTSLAVIMRFTRSSMLEVIRQDYIRTARAKGLTEFTIITKHALKNALIPVITVVGLQFGFLMGGAIVTEQIFAIPGLGNFMITSITMRDYPIIQGGVLLIAFTFSIINLAVDILYAYIDPRIRSQYN
ncbi:MAG: ABC transporter permease [Treponema sp.]|nr:ABC transporter permease [Treponema sp.]